MTDQPTTIASLVVPSRLTCLGAPNQKLSQNALSRLSPSEHVNNFWAMEKSGSIIFASQFVRVDVTTMRFQPSERWLTRRCVVIFPGTKTHSITWSWVAQGTVIHPSSATPRSEGDVKLHWKLAKVSYLPEGATTTTTKVSSFLLFGGFFSATLGCGWLIRCIQVGTGSELAVGDIAKEIRITTSTGKSCLLPAHVLDGRRRACKKVASTEVTIDSDAMICNTSVCNLLSREIN